MSEAIPILELLSVDQREKLTALVKQHRDATWIIEGGFTAISETKTDSGDYTPHWGKVSHESNQILPGVGPSATEEMTFVDGTSLHGLLAHHHVSDIGLYLTLSDSQWYKGTLEDADLSPFEKRKALAQRVNDNPSLYIPQRYRDHLFRQLGNAAHNDMRIVLQHIFSPTFQHHLTNNYSRLRKKKGDNHYTYRYHHRMFIKKRGWLYLEGRLDGGTMKLFSGPSIRAPLFEEDEHLEHSVKQEGAVGVTYSYYDNTEQEANQVNTHLCGSVSAGRMLWLANDVRARKSLSPENKVVTVHIHDTADDPHIGRKLLRGMLASNDSGPENTINIVLVKNEKTVDIYHSGDRLYGCLSDGSPLHMQLGFKEPGTMDRKIDAIIESTAFREIFEREMDKAAMRATASLALEDVRLLRTGDSSDSLPDVSRQQQCEVMCET